MIKTRYIEGVVWLCLSIFLGIESTQLGLGVFSSPGPGFIPFILALCVCLLSLLLLLQASLSKKEKIQDNVGFRVSAVYVVCLIVAYVLLFKKIGYLLSTFLLMTFFFKSMGTRRWMLALIEASLATLLSYFLFGLILKLNLPTGFF
jgi:putative tricarboxylic transport membrane protein